MKVCLYIRLSDADADLKFKSESESISSQRILLTQYLKSHREFYPHEIVEFVDDGFSGTNGNRPAFERMIAFLYEGGAKLVLCKDLSRFFRNYVEIGDYLERIFPSLGVRLIAVNDGYDSDDYKGTTGGLDVVMKCIIYAAYSRDLSQKVRTVLIAKKRKGEFTGSSAPYGFLKDPEDRHHLIPDPTVTDIVRKIFALAIEGKTTGEIARILNCDHIETPAAHHHRLYPESGKFKESGTGWTHTAVLQILHRQEFTGDLVSMRADWKTIDNPHVHRRNESDWIVVPECHEPIISREEFQNAQSVIAKKKKGSHKAHDYLLRSMVHCGHCGYTMTRNKASAHTKAYFNCRNSRVFENALCSADKHYTEEDLERFVIQSLTQVLQVTVDTEKQLREAAAKMKGTAENLRRRLEKADQGLKKLSLEKMKAYESYVDGQISREAFQTVRLRVLSETEALQKQADSLRQELSLLEQSTSSPESSRAAEKAESFLKAENITNEMLLNFIERVDVYTGMRIQITYRFRNPFEVDLELPEEIS